MPKLLLKFRDKILREIPLNKKSFSIGRTDENDIIIKNLGVSRKHARISQEGNDFIVEDLASRNGTIVNSNFISEKTTLKDKDQVIIGKHTIIVLLTEDADIETKDYNNEKDFNKFLPPDETLNVSKKPSKDISKFATKRITRTFHRDRITSITRRKKGGVKILKGAIKQDTVMFHRLLIVAGKGPTADIRIKGDYKKDVVFIINSRSNGFFISPPKGITLKINNAAVEDYTKLEQGDIIEAEETKMEFFLKP